VKRGATQQEVAWRRADIRCTLGSEANFWCCRGPWRIAPRLRPTTSFCSGYLFCNTVRIRWLADHALALLQRVVVGPPQTRRGVTQRPPRLGQRRHLVRHQAKGIEIACSSDPVWAVQRRPGPLGAAHWHWANFINARASAPCRTEIHALTCEAADYAFGSHPPLIRSLSSFQFLQAADDRRHRCIGKLALPVGDTDFTDVDVAHRIERDAVWREEFSGLGSATIFAAEPGDAFAFARPR